MRVLMVTDQYPPFIGGIERHVANLARGLVQRGHEVSVATLDATHRGGSTNEEGVTVHRLAATTQRAAGATTPSGRPYAPPFPDPEVVLGLRRVLAREKPDVVHGHNWLVRSFVALKASSGAALVVTLHDYGLVCAKRSLWYRGAPCTGPAFEKCLRCAARNYGTARGMLITLGNWGAAPAERGAVDMYLPVSRAVAEGNQLAAADAPFEVVPNFVPDDVAVATDPDHPALAALPTEPFWLFVGTLSGNKGVHVLLDAYRRLVQPPPLVLIGSRRADSPTDYPAGSLVLHDLPHPAVMAAWQRASLAIVPSIFPDPCPTVAIEAMAAGVPVVGSRVGGLADIVGDDEAGRLVEVGDAKALAAALSELHADGPLRAQLGRAGRLRARQFTAGVVLDRIEDVYRRVAA